MEMRVNLVTLLVVLTGVILWNLAGLRAVVTALLAWIVIEAVAALASDSREA